MAKSMKSEDDSKGEANNPAETAGSGGQERAGPVKLGKVSMQGRRLTSNGTNNSW